MRLILIILFMLTSLNLNLNANIKEGDKYIDRKIQPSKYKPEYFYGTWVVVKVKFFACISKFHLHYPNDFYGDWEKIEEPLGKKVIIKENFFSNQAFKGDKKNITDFKYFTYTYDGYNWALGSSFIDGDYNKYDLFTVWGSQYKKPNKVLGSEDTFIIVNKNKIVTYINDYFMYTLIREEEAIKLKKYTIEVPYNFDLTSCYIDNDEEKERYKEENEYTKKRRLSIIDKELDAIAEKLKAKGKYNVTRAYVGISAIDGEE